MAHQEVGASTGERGPSFMCPYYKVMSQEGHISEGHTTKSLSSLWSVILLPTEPRVSRDKEGARVNTGADEEEGPVFVHFPLLYQNTRGWVEHKKEISLTCSFRGRTSMIRPPYLFTSGGGFMEHDITMAEVHAEEITWQNRSRSFISILPQ